MAIGRLLVGKGGSMRTPVIQIKGDGNTHVIELIVQRYYGGIDLAPLTWSVTAKNANGAPDEYDVSNVQIKDDVITMLWTLYGTVTAAAGIARFKLTGYANADDKVLVWQSGTYCIGVIDTIEYEPGSEVGQELSNVHKLIAYVDQELPSVLAARENANSAAERANEAAERVSDENIRNVVDEYLRENPVAGGATQEQVEQINQNTSDIEELKGIVGSGGSGADGEDGATFTPSVSSDGVLSWTNDKGLTNPGPVNIKGDTGADGEDGFSPTVTVEEITGGHRVTITDANGTKSFDVMDGEDGSGGSGSGDMLKSTYDTDGSGVVDDAERLGGQPPSYYEIPEFLKAGEGDYSITGEVVTLENYKGMPMNVVTTIKLTQSGSGDPSPDNIRTIRVYTGDTLTVNDDEISVLFGQTVCSGTIDWNAGVLTVDKGYKVFNGSEVWKMAAAGRFYTEITGYEAGEYDVIADRYISSYNWASHTSSNNEVVFYRDSAWQNARMSFTSGYSSIESWQAYLSAQYAAGTPVHVCCELAAPITIQFTKYQIYAIEGMNTIYSNAGNVTVSGAKNIFSLIDALKERIAALEAAAVNNA